MELRFPFVARGERGEVRVLYSVHGNPARWGFDILGLAGDISRVAAFPVFEGSVSYPREGYAAIFAWIQVVRYWSEGAEPPTSALVDVAPQLRGFGVPFFAYGIRPTCFDAPLDTPEGCSRWEALTFLTQTPDGLMTRKIEPILGLRWGYLIDDDARSTLVPPVLADSEEWDYARSELGREYPAWNFGPTFTRSS